MLIRYLEQYKSLGRTMSSHWKQVVLTDDVSSLMKKGSFVVSDNTLVFNQKTIDAIFERET